MRTLAAAGVLATFTVLTVVLLKNQIEEIPQRDVATSMLLMASSLASVVSALLFGEQRRTVDKTSHRRSDSFLRVSSQLMQWEVLFTIVVPWFLLKCSGVLRHQLHFIPDRDNAIDHLLVPHLYFFHAQIVGEAILMVSHQDSLVFPYTCLANAFRAFPLATWFQRAVLASQEIQQYNPFHWLLVAGLPLVATILWLYSSFVFLPLKWYPVVQQDELERRQQRGPEVTK